MAARPPAPPRPPQGAALLREAWGLQGLLPPDVETLARQVDDQA